MVSMGTMGASYDTVDRRNAGAHHLRCIESLTDHLENIVYHFFRKLWLALGVKLMEINSNLFFQETSKLR